MNRRSCSLPPLSFITASLLLGLVVPLVQAQGTIPAQMLREIKHATVFVRIEASGRLLGSGSGFLIKVDGDTGYVATNHHVIDASDMPFAGLLSSGPSIRVVFDSGTPQERSVRATVTASDPDKDLAVIKVETKDLPRPISLGGNAIPVETMSVYACGFPFGTALSATKGNPAITIGRQTISSVRQDEQGELAVVQLDGALNPGNSGGPVLDDKGRLVGIVVSGIRGSGIGMAIPAHELKKMLQGRVQDLAVTDSRVVDGMAEIRIQAGLIDPLNQIKTVHLHLANLNEKPRRAKGAWPVIPGVRKVTMKVANQSAEATVRVPENRLATLWFQATCLSGNGKTLHSKPGKLVKSRPRAMGTQIVRRNTSRPRTMPSPIPATRPSNPAMPRTELATAGPPPPAPAPTMSMNQLNRSPRSHVNKKVVLKGWLAGGYTRRGRMYVLDVRNENQGRPINLFFITSQKTADQWKNEGPPPIPGRIYTVRITATVTAQKVQALQVVSVSRIDVITTSDRISQSIPSNLPPGVITIEALFRSPDRFLNRTVTVDARLFSTVVIQGETCMLQVVNQNWSRPAALKFTVSRDIAAQLTDEIPAARNPFFVRLSCKVLKKKNDAAEQVVQVVRVDFVNEAGKILKTVR